MDRMVELNRQMDLRRMPKVAGAEDKEELSDMGVMFDWLFNIRFRTGSGRVCERHKYGGARWDVKAVWTPYLQRFAKL